MKNEEMTMPPKNSTKRPDPCKTCPVLDQAYDDLIKAFSEPVPPAEYLRAYA